MTNLPYFERYVQIASVLRHTIENAADHETPSGLYDVRVLSVIARDLEEGTLASLLEPNAYQPPPQFPRREAGFVQDLETLEQLYNLSVVARNGEVQIIDNDTGKASTIEEIQEGLEAIRRGANLEHSYPAPTR